MDMALDAIEKALDAAPRADHRHRIEHLGNWMITKERLARIRRLEVLPVPNVPFLHYIWESLLACMGPERLEGSFGIKTMLESGIPITSGSDGPGYWPADPLRDMATTGVTPDLERRHDRRGRGRSPWPRRCACSRSMPPITASTSVSRARSSRASSPISPCSRTDPFTIAPERIKDIPVDMTIVDGRIAFVHEGVQGL